ncbi:hypothetical protein [Mesorhizobium sp. KR9-304]|uniref:hypothetical protein n=1 Tax=Mesorhizobium sp. KR9-304 TaxID=3156614 RepID=UPI0032B33E54
MLKTTTAGFVAMIAGAATLDFWPMDRDLHRGNYRVAMEALYIDVDFFGRFGVDLPMFPRGFQDVYYNDIVVVNLIEQGCTAFRTRSLEWHPYTRKGILSGLETIKAGRTADIVRRIYGSPDASADEECDRDAKMVRLQEDVQAMNEELLWNSPAFAWKSEDERDADLIPLLERLMPKKD